MRPGAAVASVLLPPLGVHLAGGRARRFWIASALTALGFAPGVVYALGHLIQQGRTPA